MKTKNKKKTVFFFVKVENFLNNFFCIEKRKTFHWISKTMQATFVILWWLFKILLPSIMAENTGAIGGEGREGDFFALFTRSWSYDGGETKT